MSFALFAQILLFYNLKIPTMSLIVSLPIKQIYLILVTLQIHGECGPAEVISRTLDHWMKLNQLRAENADPAQVNVTVTIQIWDW